MGVIRNPLLNPELRELLAQGDAAALRDFCQEEHPATVAEMLSGLDGAEAWAVLRHADAVRRAEVFSHMGEDLQADIIGVLRREEIAGLLSDMPPDDRADLFKRMPEQLRESVLPALAQAEREDIRRLASYREGTAGAAMTSDYATLTPGMTAAQAVEHLREVAPDKETIYYAYVVDDHRRLVGFVSLKDLIVARREATVGDLMHEDVISAKVDDDQEEVARKIQKFDLLAVPVVNESGSLVGIITHDDAIDIITQEHTEDMEKLMAIAGRHEAGVYLKTPSWEHFKNRAGWLVVLAALGMISGYIVQSFERLLMQFAVLAAFMPMLADTGGNTGSQSATLVVRALALKEISPGDLVRVLFKELKVSVMLGLLLAVLAFGRVIVFDSARRAGSSSVMLGVAIAAALGIQVVSATLIGVLLPMIAARLKLDPALVASPALTTVVDITGLLIFFTTARLLLGI